MFTKTPYTLTTDNGFRVLEVMPIFQKSKDRSHLCMPENYIIHEQLLQIEYDPQFFVTSNIVFLGALIVPWNGENWTWHGNDPGFSMTQFEEIVSFIRHYEMPHLKDIGIYNYPPSVQPE
jgi:hypothetical protein